MKLTALKFDTPNNACASLRILAELVRRGEINAIAQPVDGGGSLPVRFAEPSRRERRARAETSRE